MKKITKKEFINKITNGESIFIGISPAIEMNECKERVEFANKRVENGQPYLYTKRTCKVTSGLNLKFSNDSYLSLADNNKANLTIECYEEDNILVVSETWECHDWQGNLEETRVKNMHYALV